jgi:hypothetical protein
VSSISHAALNAGDTGAQLVCNRQGQLDNTKLIATQKYSRPSPDQPGRLPPTLLTYRDDTILQCCVQMREVGLPNITLDVSAGGWTLLAMHAIRFRTVFESVHPSAISLVLAAVDLLPFALQPWGSTLVSLSDSAKENSV